MGTGEYQPGREHRLPAEGSGSVARLGPRLVAYLFDLAVTAGLAWAYGPYLALAFANLVILPVRWGTTLGHAAVRLRIVPLVDGELLLDQRGLTVLTALGRALEWLCCWPLTPLMLLSADVDRRTLVDRWTKTIVLEW